MIKDNYIPMIGRIAVITGDYPMVGHMRYVFVQELVHAMIDQGADITVVAPQSVVHSIVHREKLLPRISYARTQEGKEYKVLRPYIITLGKRRFFSKVINYWNSVFLNRLLNRIQPDVFYAHFWYSALSVYPYVKKHKKPLYVACGEGDNAIEEMVQTLSIGEIENLKSAVNGVISVSSENKKKCIDFHLIDPGSIEVFPNCVDTGIFKKADKTGCRCKLGISNDDFLIVFVGGFNLRKGPDRLAHAISMINDPSIKVVFAGKNVPGYPLDFDCPGIVHKGPVDHKDLPLYLNSADVFVLPTQKEGCCNAIVEALSVGIPVISSNGSFNDDILDEKNSIRIDPNDVSGIKDAILQLKNNKVLCNQMIEVSLSRHNTYSVHERAKKILSFIQRKLSNQ